MKQKVISITLIIALLGLTIVGCSSSQPTNTAQALTDDIEFATNSEVYSINDLAIIEATDIFGLDVFKKEVFAEENENIIVSPVSIFTAFNVLQNGADSATKEQLKDALNIGSISDEQLNNEMNVLINYLNTERIENSGFAQICNSIWIDNNFTVKDTYLDVAKKYYNSDIYNANFSDSGTLDEMNDWIYEKSNGLIEGPISDLSPDLCMTIFNVLYFKGVWADSFSEDKTKTEDFYLKNGETVKVDMMNDERMLDYYEDEDVQVGALDYYNGKMLLLLPKGDIDEYITKLDNELIKSYSNDFEYTNVDIKLPKFDVEYKNNLNDTLMALGMEDAFNSSSADFSNINQDTDIFVSEVLHDCVVKVDEEGTEAAALTAIMLEATSMPVIPETVTEFHIDKPFIFVIQDNSSDMILFIGKIQDPS